MYTYRKRVEQRPENKLIHVSALFRACYRAMIPNRTACLICTLYSTGLSACRSRFLRDPITRLEKRPVLPPMVVNLMIYID